MVFVDFPIVNQSIMLLEYQLFCFLILLILVEIALSPLSRAAIRAVIKQKNVAVAMFLSLGALLFTLIPAPPTLSNKSTWPATFYHILTSLSTILFIFGICPLANVLSRWQSCRRIMIFTWEKVKSLFLNVKTALFLGLLLVVVFILTNLASYFLFEHIPHIVDSGAQLFHGKIFAKGKLTVPSHVHREFFDLFTPASLTTMINNGKWYSQYPPGHSFMLMLGVFIDAPWIVNPLLGSLTVIMLYFLGAELYDKTTGRLSALLAALSPFILFMSSEFMNHTSALFFFTSFMLFFAKTVRHGKIGYAIATGASLGMVLNVRPLTAVGLALPFCIYGCYLLMTRFRELRLPMAAVVVSFLIFVGILLGFNALTTGNPWVFGYEVLYGPQVKPGFGHAAWGETLTPIYGLYKTFDNLNGINIFLFEWPVPSLVFMCLLFASLTRNQWDYLLVAAFLSLTTAYFFYWFQHWCFGPRFLYESATALIMLTARGLLCLPKLVRNILGFSASVRRVQIATASFVAACFFIAAVVNIPPLIKQYGNSFAGVNAAILKTVKARGLKKAIVFTRAYYGNVFTGNSPLLDGDVIYARDLGEKNHLLMAMYPGYEYYLADGENIQLLKKK
jgi:hypothetical protein